MKDLVILTKKFGKNYTGATVATQKLCEDWAKRYQKVTILTFEIGEFEKKENMEIFLFPNIFSLMKKIYAIKSNDSLFYSDDHLGFLLGFAGINYLHTYHGNWPEARWIDMNFFLKSLFFMPAYKLTLRKANRVINVSYYMDKFTRKYNGNSLVIRNGTSQNSDEVKKVGETNNKIIMVGNIDERKYGTCLKLFRNLSFAEIDITIDIYGSIIDKDLYDKLSLFEFVNIKGFVNDIDFSNYDFMLCTSTIENLPISIVEAAKARIPVFAYNVGGINEIIVSGNNGFLVSNKNADKLSKLIENYYSKGWNFNFQLSRIKLAEFNWEVSYILYFEQLQLMDEEMGKNG
ncbi:glycosyltransferase [Enterococcus casseliflavus]|uniref:glycosyltransferase n=1 Tax=Enterococcus casseliflavus TaxID=37734 RepID=UPI001BCA6E53|nr:glycosyltransferase [Enterococcus casseliflavus]